MSGKLYTFSMFRKWFEVPAFRHAAAAMVGESRTQGTVNEEHSGNEEDRIEGTTTAASLWVVAAIGIAAGLGYYKEAVATALLSYGILAGLWYIERHWRTKIRYDNGHSPAEHEHQ